MTAITTPFGRGRFSASQFSTQLAARAAIYGLNPPSGPEAAAIRPPGNLPTAVHKWKLLRALTEGRDAFNIGERALTVLSALLSFHPETALSLSPKAEAGARATGPSSRGDGEDAPETGATDAGPDDGREWYDASLVVFPSNRELSLRAQGLGERSLARHLAVLVEAGFVIRRDSPNGKRYARRAQGGSIDAAFGFDLSPLVLRAPEIEDAAEAAQRRQRRSRALRERVSLARRDCSGLLALGLELEHGPAASLIEDYGRLLDGVPMPRRNSPDETVLAAALTLEALKRELVALLAAPDDHGEDGPASEGTAGCVSAEDSEQESGNDGQTVSHHQSSKTKHLDSELASEEAGRQVATVVPGNALETGMAPETKGADTKGADTKVGNIVPHGGDGGAAHGRLSPGFVRSACPALKAWSAEPLRDWPSILRAAAMARAALGVSADAWDEAVESMGERIAAVTVAAILERVEQAQGSVAATPEAGKAAENGGSSAMPVLIRSPGGYLRSLAAKAKLGKFQPEPFLMAVMATQVRSRPAR